MAKTKYPHYNSLRDLFADRWLSRLKIYQTLDPTLYERIIWHLERKAQPRYVVLHNHHLVGLKSQTLRQLDIAVMWGETSRETLLKIVACRAKARKLDLQTVADAIEMKGDLQPSRIEFCSSSGFSQGAVKRLTAEGIRCRTVSWADGLRALWWAREGNPLCHWCRHIGNPTTPGIVSWEFTEYLPLPSSGFCNYCGTRYECCPECGKLTMISDADYGKGVKCWGCNRVYVAVLQYDSNDVKEADIWSYDELHVKLLVKAFKRHPHGITTNDVREIVEHESLQRLYDDEFWRAFGDLEWFEDRDGNRMVLTPAMYRFVKRYLLHQRSTSIDILEELAPGPFDPKSI